MFEDNLSEKNLIVSYSSAIWCKNCALWGKSTKFGMVIVFKLLKNTSYGPQSGVDFVLRGVGLGDF